MKNLKHFLLDKIHCALFALGLSAILAGLSLGVVVDNTDNASTPTPNEADESSEAYETVPPLQIPSQPLPPLPDNSGSVLPTPPTYLDPNAGQQNLPKPPTGQTPYGTPAPSPSGGMTGGNNAMPINPLGNSGPMAANPMMPASPTPSLNLNQLGTTDPKYGRFESARLEASLMPHQATQMNAARNQVVRGAKPFAGYRQPPAYSPYMSLLRTQDSIRGIDNYYEYVMPMIQQEQRNKQFNREITGLQSTARSGYQTLIQIKQRPSNAPVQSGARAPATFMNTGGYFNAGGSR